jgi:hypothetical protein
MEDGNVVIGAKRATFRLLAHDTRSAMLRHFAIHSGNRIRTIEILCEAKRVGIANVAIDFDQLTAEQIELRTSKRVHVDAPVLFRNKEIGSRNEIRSSGPCRTSRVPEVRSRSSPTVGGTAPIARCNEREALLHRSGPADENILPSLRATRLPCGLRYR